MSKVLWKQKSMHGLGECWARAKLSLRSRSCDTSSSKCSKASGKSNAWYLDCARPTDVSKEGHRAFSLPARRCPDLSSPSPLSPYCVSAFKGACIEGHFSYLKKKHSLNRDTPQMQIERARNPRDYRYTLIRNETISCRHRIDSLCLLRPF